MPSRTSPPGLRGLATAACVLLAAACAGQKGDPGEAAAPPLSYWKGGHFVAATLPFQLDAPTREQDGGYIPTFANAYDDHGVAHVVFAAQEGSYDCAWQDGGFQCGPMLPQTVVCLGDVDGDGATDMVSTNGELQLGNGRMADVSSTDGGQVAACIIHPGGVLVGRINSCLPDRPPSLSLFDWTDGRPVPVPFEQPAEIRPQASMFWGHLLGQEVIVSSASGCGDPNEPMFFRRTDAGFVPFLQDAPVQTRELPMGVTVFDANGDGRDDLIVTIDPLVLLLEDDGHGGLVQAPVDPGFHQKDAEGRDLVGWGIAQLDLDHDGRTDVCIANGFDEDRHQRGWQGKWWTTCYWNAGGGRFVNVSSALGTDKVLGQWWNIQAFDVDHDGHDDLVVGGQSTPPVVLLWRTG